MTADPAEPPTTCDQDTWDHYRNRTDLPEHLLDWLADQCSGWPDYDFADRHQLTTSLLDSPAAASLTERQLIRMTNWDGPPSGAAAQALVHHRATTPGVVAAVLNAVLNATGTRRRQGRSGDIQSNVIRALARDDRTWVRAMTAVRRRGLALWHPDWADAQRLLAGHGEAQRSYLDAMARLHSLDDPTVWDAVLFLAEHPDGFGPAETLALTLALDPATR